MGATILESSFERNTKTRVEDRSKPLGMSLAALLETVLDSFYSSIEVPGIILEVYQVPWYAVVVPL